MKIEIGSLVIVIKDTYSFNIGKSGILRGFDESENLYPYYVEFDNGNSDLVQDVIPVTELMKALM